MCFMLCAEKFCVRGKVVPSDSVIQSMDERHYFFPRRDVRPPNILQGYNEYLIHVLLALTYEYSLLRDCPEEWGYVCGVSIMMGKSGTVVISYHTMTAVTAFRTFVQGLNMVLGVLLGDPIAVYPIFCQK